MGGEPITVSDRSITWTGTTGGDIIQLIQVTDGSRDHGFYTGEVITFNVIQGVLGELEDGKNYFVKRENSNEIRLAGSLSDLVNEDYVKRLLVKVRLRSLFLNWLTKNSKTKNF